MGSSRAGHCRHGQSNTPYPFPIWYTSHSAQLPFFCPQDHCKMEKTAPPMQTTSQFILIKHSHFNSNHGTGGKRFLTIRLLPPLHSRRNCSRAHQDTSNQAWALPHTTQNSPQSTSQVRKQLRRLHHPLTTPNNPSPPGYCPHFNFCGNRSRTCKDTSNQAQALHHTSQYTHQSNINISEEITVTPPSTDNAKWSLTSRLLPTLQLSRNLLENLWRYTQSSASLPPHLPKFTSIEHHRFGSNHGTAAATQGYTRSFTTRLLILTAHQFVWKLLEKSLRFTQSSASPITSHIHIRYIQSVWAIDMLS